MAMASASSSALAASTTAMSCSAASACAAKSGSPSRVCQSSVAAAGRSASDASRSRPCGCGRRQRRHRVARDADPAQQRVHGELRMAVRGVLVVRRSASRTARRDRCRARAAPPRRAAAWRWSRAAPRSPASSRSSPRRSPGRPLWRAAPARPRSAGRAARPARSCRARRGSPASARARIFRNSSVSCQYLSMSARHQRRRACPSSPAASSCRPSAGRGRSASISADAGLPATSGASPGACRLELLRPFQDQLGQHHAALQPAERVRAARAPAPRSRRPRLRRRRSRPRRRRRSARCAAGSRRRRRAVEEHVARQPAGAPRRQVERRAGERERIAGRPGSPAPAGRRAARRSASAGTAPTPGS